MLKGTVPEGPRLAGPASSQCRGPSWPCAAPHPRHRDEPPSHQGAEPTRVQCAACAAAAPPAEVADSAVFNTQAHHTKVSRKSAVPESKANDKRKILDKGTRLRKK